MSNWAKRRQIIYIIGAVIFFVVLLFFGYLIFSPEPTCFDNKKNGDELDVDCGGSCMRACSAQVDELRVLWVRAFQGNAEQAYAMAAIENRNNEIARRNLNYTIRVFNEENFLISEKSGSTYVNPREKLVIFEGGIKTGNQIATKAEIEFTSGGTWESFTPVAKPVIAVEQEYIELSPQTRLGVRITNTSVYDLDDITVPVLLYDDRGNVVGGSSTYIDHLNRGQGKEVIYLWPEETLVKPTSIEFYPRVNLFKVK